MAEFIKDVYNKDIKDLFLNEIELDKYPPRWWERLFESSCRAEKELSKDLCCFTVDEIIEFYKYLDKNSFEALLVININLIKYGDWALGNSLIIDGQNHYTEINNSIIMKCINKMGVIKSILTLDDMIQVCKKIINEQDRFIYFALFEGIKGKTYDEIINLKMSDIDEKNMTATLCSGRTIKVSKEFIRAAKSADAQTSYIMENGQLRKLIPSSRIYKEKANVSVGNMPKSIYRVILKNNETVDGLNKNINSNSIFHSGMIHYFNEIARANNMSVREIMDEKPELFEDIYYKYNFNPMMRSRFLMKFEYFLV